MTHTDSTRNYPNLKSLVRNAAGKVHGHIRLTNRFTIYDPGQASNTIIGTVGLLERPSDSLGITLTWGLSLGMLHRVHGPIPRAKPFTIRSFSDCPTAITSEAGLL